MKHITFYLDFVSPYAYLAFEKLPEVLMGQSYAVSYKPVLLGAILKHHGQLGPAEVPAKRDWTYRHVLWLGRSQQVELALPAQHPFNPLPLLRFAIAAAEGGHPNRYLCETLFHHVWRGGGDPLDAARLQALRQRLPAAADADVDAVKAQLKRNTDEALARGVFGVPSYAVDGKLFWGFDGLPLLRDHLAGDPWFDGPAWHGVSGVPVGVTRQK